MSNDLEVTVVGWAATTPREIVGDGTPFTSFRLATTPRRYDTRLAAWTDGRTEWFTVKAFRETALNVAASIHKGEPVVVHGRLRSEEWAGDNGPRTSLVIDVIALGHDVTRGRSSFVRRVHVGGAGPEDGGAPQEPVDDPWATDGAPSGEVTSDAADELAVPTP